MGRIDYNKKTIFCSREPRNIHHFGGRAKVLQPIWHPSMTNHVLQVLVARNGQTNMKRPCESPVKFETIAINDWFLMFPSLLIIYPSCWKYLRRLDAPPCDEAVVPDLFFVCAAQHLLENRYAYVCEDIFIVLVLRGF